MNGSEGMEGLAMMQQTKRKNNLLPGGVSVWGTHQTKIAILPLTLETSRNGNVANNADVPKDFSIFFSG